MQLITSEQIRQIENAAIDSGAVTGFELMQRAGEKVVSALLKEWPCFQSGKHSACILAGPGNNGGDGYIVAKMLLDKGWQVDLVKFGTSKTADALFAADQYVQAGGVVVHNPMGSYDVIIDAIFGAGLKRLLAEIDLPEADHVLSVDAPSGLCLDSGRVLGAAIKADLTVTFHQARIGHYLASGPQYCGKLVVADIGLEQKLSGVNLHLGLDEDVYEKHSDSHKYQHGSVMVISGGLGKSGASRLAARAALRSGAGLVTVASPSDAMHENAAQLTAIMLQEFDGDIEYDPRINAVVIGPGCGITKQTEKLVRESMHSGRTCVFDADALTVISGSRDEFFELFKGQKIVMTPHEGEFKRLFPDIFKDWKSEAKTGPVYSKVEAVRAAALRSGATLVLKGADTIIADPDGLVTLVSASYDRQAPWLATAGSGDVLAGFIAGLIARRVSNPVANAVFMHQECGRILGAGLISEDLPEIIPQIYQKPA